MVTDCDTCHKSTRFRNHRLESETHVALWMSNKREGKLMKTRKLNSKRPWKWFRLWCNNKSDFDTFLLRQHQSLTGATCSDRFACVFIAFSPFTIYIHYNLLNNHDVSSEAAGCCTFDESGADSGSLKQKSRDAIFPFISKPHAESYYWQFRKLFMAS